MVIVVGAGGCGREVASILEAAGREVLGYVIDEEYGVQGDYVDDHMILGDPEWLTCLGWNRFGQGRVICAVGRPEDRYGLVRRLHGPFTTVVHPSAMFPDSLEIGTGSVLSLGCIVTDNVEIGEHVQLNIASTVSHDSILEDFVTLSPGAHVAGNVTIDAGTFVGMGANIIEGVHIGAWSRIGAGAVVMEDVPANSTVVGMPARVVRMREAGWHE